MISAISSALPASLGARTPFRRPAGRSSSKTGWDFQPVPNLNRATRQAIGQAKAGWTFTTICTELGYACYKGKATWDQQRLGIGLRALARESGQDVRKVRRDCDALAKLGLVVISRPKILHVCDPATGRITTKAKGRCESAVIYLTITEAVLRPAKGSGGAMGGATVEPPPAACKGHHGTTVREEKKQRTPDGDAVGIGTPLAGQDAGLPAGEAGRLPAATPEEPAILPLAAGRDEPVIPSGRILPSTSKPATGRDRGTGHRPAGYGQEERRSAAEASAAFCRPDPRMEEMRRAYLESKRRKAAAAMEGRQEAEAIGRATDDQDRAADELSEALRALPDDSRERARDHGRQLTEDPEVAALNRIINERKRQERQQQQIEAEARREAARPSAGRRGSPLAVPAAAVER